MYPFLMKPYIRDIVWGGTRLRDVYAKTLSVKAAESWEVSANRDGESSIANGELAGETLSSVIAKFPNEVLGKADAYFPYLFKLIDANDDLSIQVHPNDEYAQRVEHEPVGKTEVWYIIDAEPGAKIGFGLCEPLNRTIVEKAVIEGNLEKYINYINVQPGGVFFIPAGLVHCLCGGLLVAELQQNSNLTYRLYDYNRVTNGQKRELHIEKGLDVCDFNKSIYVPPTENNGVLCECEYFTLKKINIKNRYTVDIDTFNIIFFLSGGGVIRYAGGEADFKYGDTFLLPHDLTQCEITGECEMLLC